MVARKLLLTHPVFVWYAANFLDIESEMGGRQRPFMAPVTHGGCWASCKALTSGHLRPVSVTGSCSPCAGPWALSPPRLYTPTLGIFCDCCFNLNYCYSLSTKDQKGFYLQKAYFIFPFNVYLHLSYWGLPEVEAGSLFLPSPVLLACVLSLQIDLHKCPYMKIHAYRYTLRRKYVCVHVYILFIGHVCTHTQNHTLSKFWVKSFHHSLPPISFWKPFPISGHSLFPWTLPVWGAHYGPRQFQPLDTCDCQGALCLRRNLPPATPASSSWCILCLRPWESHSSSS